MDSKHGINGGKKNANNHRYSNRPHNSINSLFSLMTKRAFTLFEAMIVVSIIALLATIAIPTFQRARQRTIERQQQRNTPNYVPRVGEPYQCPKLQERAEVIEDRRAELRKRAEELRNVR